jgi:hypothetical protein
MYCCFRNVACSLLLPAGTVLWRVKLHTGQHTRPSVGSSSSMQGQLPVAHLRSDVHSCCINHRDLIAVARPKQQPAAVRAAAKVVTMGGVKLWLNRLQEWLVTLDKTCFIASPRTIEIQV